MPVSRASAPGLETVAVTARSDHTGTNGFGGSGAIGSGAIGSGAIGSGGIGRPRDPEIDDAVLTVTAEMVRNDGYGALSIAAVAARAGTTKPAVYRRWPGRRELIIAALAREVDIAAAPDSGCTRCDLISAIENFTDAFRTKLPPRVLAPLIADCASDPPLHDHALETLFLPLRNATREVLDRAAGRGDLRADTDPELVLDLLASMVHYRGLFGHAPITPELIVKQVDTLLRGIAPDPARLAGTDRAHGAAHGQSVRNSRS